MQSGQPDIDTRIQPMLRARLQHQEHTQNPRRERCREPAHPTHPGSPPNLLLTVFLLSLGCPRKPDEIGIRILVKHGEHSIPLLPLQTPIHQRSQRFIINRFHISSLTRAGETKHEPGHKTILRTGKGWLFWH
ncbi:hypothetical protein ThidrDRAFT_4433 [Thiorhodococcus drewsii AZ1]|uniref:Uncharacterized protein n=1 Tax=Thiorhodococcus drewsii AZ1 TaxID=765913 RepID=G2E819_9GAMM|nr:hypothetical protein ThidrDRAFT_4433 [Thiorhodococcus drewsii AZ1]